MTRIPTQAIATLFALSLAGCGGCNKTEEAPPPAATPTAAAAAPADAAPATGAPADGAAAAPEAGGEVDCFVIVDAEPDFGAPPLTVNFITETDCTGEPVSYSWDFGDGTKGGNEAKPSHTYDKPGDYIAVVTASAPDGGHGTDEIDVTVDTDLSD